MGWAVELSRDTDFGLCVLRGPAESCQPKDTCQVQTSGKALTFLGTHPTDEPTTSGFSVIECLFEAAARALCQRKRNGGRVVTAPVRFSAGLGDARGDIVFRLPTFPFLGRRTEDDSLSDRQSTDASDRAVDPGVVLVRTNDRFQRFWRRTC
jgi:hypothetical protein